MDDAKQPQTPPTGSKAALNKLRSQGIPLASYVRPIVPPKLFAGVVPKDKTAPVMAMDYNSYGFATELYDGGGFPGYAYLSQLSTRAEYRAFASTMSTELTREWITITSKQDDDEGAKEKIKLIEAEIERLKLRSVFQTAAEHDCYFGRAQLFIDIRGQKKNKPLILDKRTIPQGSLEAVRAVEAIWTTPSVYNANDPSAVNFYRPSNWYMLGTEVHGSRLLTVVTRPLPDILKPAYNFGGMSLSQLAEPYVDNWLRTRQSVSDLISNFSITALATSMDQVLQGTDDGAGVFARAELFTLTRSNKGVMLLDKENEEIIQTNTPLSGLHELQAQSQEQMCSVSRMPAIILTGISPGGLNASSDSEIRVFYDWIAAQQEAYWRAPLDIIIKVIQLSLFGEIDEDIGFSFVPLFQMDAKQLSEIRKADADAAVAYINAGVIDPSEERERIARDPESGYIGLDTSIEIVPPAPDPAENPFGGGNDPTQPDNETDDTEQEDAPDPVKAAQDSGGILAAMRRFFRMAFDAEFVEADHPRAANGQFGSGGSAKTEPGKSEQADQYDKGGTDEHGQERAPGLDASERKIEQDFYDDVRTNGAKLIEAYHEANGNVIDPDLVKGLNNEFAANPDLARAVHEPSSALAKRIYSEALDRKAAANDMTPTVFSAGGGGSGKSTTRPVAEAVLGADPNGLFYDSTLSSAASATKRIDEALAKTKGEIGIAYTNMPIDQALRMNAKRSRTVSIDTLLHAHVGASDTIRKLAEHYKDDPRVQIAVVNNAIGKDPALGTVADVPKYNAFEIREQLVRQAKDMLRSGEIDKNKYELLVK